ncbi:MAG: hypothetical protein Q9178_003766 [Gyalolechia marmorata]
MPSLIALAFWTLSCSSILSQASILPRKAHDQNLKCQNPPYTTFPAGELLPAPEAIPAGRMKRYDPAALDPHAEYILCASGTETFVKLTRKYPTLNPINQKNDKDSQEQLQGLVADSWSFIKREYLENPQKGDGVINNNNNPFEEESTGWIFQRQSSHNIYKLQVANYHDKQPGFSLNLPTVRIVGNEITWGVLDVALQALGQHMVSDTYGWTECELEIWDGENAVGRARIVKADI